jgi:hypothetical protein
MYLFNYIHKLEFLISKIVQDRADFDLKFKKLVSHISRRLTQKNILSGDLDRVLKCIHVMTPQDSDALAKKRGDDEEPQENTDLRKLVGESSNLNQGYASEQNGYAERMEGTNGSIITTSSPVNIPCKINWIKETGKEISLPDKQNLFEIPSLNKISANLNKEVKRNHGEPKGLGSQAP